MPNNLTLTNLKTRKMKTITLLKQAEEILIKINSVTCADYKDFDNMVDFESNKKLLQSISETIKSYKSNKFKANAKLKFLPL